MDDRNANNIIFTGKAAERFFDYSQASVEFDELFNVENPDARAIAILGATFLEMALEHILYAFLPEDDSEVSALFEPNQPLASFSSKIRFCYCLGLIDKLIKDDLNIVRKIRNRFAHELKVSFDDEPVRSWSHSLTFHRVAMTRDIPEGVTAWQVFQVGVNQLIAHLSGCIGIARDEKRSIQNTLGQFLKQK